MNEISIGDYVKINDQGSVGEVISIKGNTLEVAIGPMKMMVKKNRVSLSQEAPQQSLTSYDVPKNALAGIDIQSKLMHFKFEMDVRGKMKDEVITELTAWTDDAILLGISDARILHGKGSSVIKNTVRSMLRKYQEIESLTDADQYDGGDSVTIVKFRK